MLLSSHRATTKVVPLPMEILILTVHVHVFSCHATSSSTSFRVSSQVPLPCIFLGIHDINRYMINFHLSIYKRNSLKAKYMKHGIQFFIS